MDIKVKQMILMIYLITAVFLVVLVILSRHEKLMTKEKITGIEAVMRKMAVFLYRHGRAFVKSKRNGDGLLFEQVRKDLVILNPSAKPERELALHQIKKIQMFLTFLAAGNVLALAIWISEQQDDAIQKDGTISRPSYEESDVTVVAKATGNTGGENISYGEYEIVVSSRRYSKEEAEQLAGELFNALPERMIGENRSFSYITENLVLERSVPGYPFQISWESSCYELVDSDGSVKSDNLEKGEHQKITLTAELSYEGQKWSHDYEILLFHKEKSQEEERSEAVLQELEREKEKSAEKESMTLPNMIDGTVVAWTEVKEESSGLIFFLIVGAGAAALIATDRELHQQILKRDRELALDYPLIISKMTLYLGAGMSIRNIFYRLGEDYQKKKEKGGGRRYVYEEILLVCRELDNGISETTAYADFGRRCHSRQYSKLSALLLANQTKGNNALLKALQEEADKSFEERRVIARQMGEEAGTKLLLPMMLMLGVTLVIIMIPAYFSFSI